MKTIRNILAVLLVSVMTGCTGNPDNMSQEGDMCSLVASIAPDGPLTRTILMDNPGVRVSTSWTGGDAITIFGPSGSRMSLSVADEDIFDSGKTAVFRSSMALPKGEISAIYPADDNASISGGKITTVFPDSQQYSLEDGLPQPDPSVSIMAGTGSASGGVAFCNVMAVLKIGQSFDEETTVTAVTFRDLSGKAVAGTISIDPSDNFVSQVSDGATTITLDCGKGVEMVAGATGVFYIIVPAREYPNGVEIAFVTSTGKQITRQAGVSNGITLGRGVVYPVGNISNRDYVAGTDASVLADNATLMTPEVLQQIAILSSKWEAVVNSEGGYVYYDKDPIYAPYYSMLIPNDMGLKEGDYLVFEATDDLPSGGVFQITNMETPYVDENHSRIEVHLTTDFAKAFKKLDYGEQLFDSNGEIVEDAGEDIDLASYLSEVRDSWGNSVQYSISEQGQIQFSEDVFQEAITKAISKMDRSISSPKLSMTITDPSQVCEANIGAMLTISMKAGLKVEDGELRWLHFMFNPQIKLSANFAIKGAVSKSKSFHLITLYFIPGIPVAPGVVLTPELEIRGSIGVGGEIVFSTSIEYTYDMGRYGFSYNNGQGFTFHHYESEPKPKDDFKPELGASLSGTVYAQGTITAIPSISLFRVLRAGIYVDFSLKFGLTAASETIENNIYDTRKLFLTPEIAFSPYVASLGGAFTTKWENLIPKIEFDPLWERYLDPVMDHSTTINLIAPGADEIPYVVAVGESYYKMTLNTQAFFGAMFTMNKIVQSVDGFSFSCKSLKPTLDDWEVCVLVKSGEFSGSWKSVCLGSFRFTRYMPDAYTGLVEQNRYKLMDIPNNQKEGLDVSASGEIFCPGEFNQGEVRSLHLVCVNKSNGRIYTIKESYPFTYCWPSPPDGPWWNVSPLSVEEYTYYQKNGWHVWPSNIPLPF